NGANRQVDQLELEGRFALRLAFRLQAGVVREQRLTQKLDIARAGRRHDHEVADTQRALHGGVDLRSPIGIRGGARSGRGAGQDRRLDLELAATSFLVALQRVTSVVAAVKRRREGATRRATGATTAAAAGELL